MDLYFPQEGVWPGVASKASLEVLLRNMLGTSFVNVTHIDEIAGKPYRRECAPGEFNYDGLSERE